MAITVRCPICEKEMVVTRVADWPSFPFCSERCRTIDLGRWLGNRYRVPAEADESNEEETNGGGAE